MMMMMMTTKLAEWHQNGIPCNSFAWWNWQDCEIPKSFPRIRKRLFLLSFDAFYTFLFNHHFTTHIKHKCNFNERKSHLFRFRISLAAKMCLITKRCVNTKQWMLPIFKSISFSIHSLLRLILHTANSQHQFKSNKTNAHNSTEFVVGLYWTVSYAVADHVCVCVCVLCLSFSVDLCARQSAKSSTNDNNANNVISNTISFHLKLISLLRDTTNDVTNNNRNDDWQFHYSHIALPKCDYPNKMGPRIYETTVLITVNPIRFLESVYTIHGLLKATSANFKRFFVRNFDKRQFHAKTYKTSNV